VRLAGETRLIRCKCLVSAVYQSITQTMVQLGINVGEVCTNATLRDALENAFKMVGLNVDALKQLSDES